MDDGEITNVSGDWRVWRDYKVFTHPGGDVISKVKTVPDLSLDLYRNAKFIGTLCILKFSKLNSLRLTSLVFIHRFVPTKITLDFNRCNRCKFHN